MPDNMSLQAPQPEPLVRLMSHTWVPFEWLPVGTPFGLGGVPFVKVGSRIGVGKYMSGTLNCPFNPDDYVRIFVGSNYEN
jgi:hypothetical protein